METVVQAGAKLPKLALTRTEAAEALGVAPVTIDRLTKRGLLHPSRATRRPLYPIWEIERFLRETSVEIEL
jgi:ribosomal protein S20